jgi:hypothetical protein
MTSSATKGGLCLATLLGAAFSAAQIQVNLDGDAIAFPDVQPQTIDGQVMVPVRTVFEKMGANVTWDEATQTVTADVNGKMVSLQIGNSEASFDGQMRYLPVPPRVVDNRTMVPMKFLGDSMGNDLMWNGGSSLLAITTGSNSAVATITTPAQALHVISLAQNEVLPVTLDMSLSTTENHVGDTFTATVSDEEATGLPSATKLEGHVAAIQPMQDGQPAVLDLAFDRIDFPNGTSRSIDAALVSLDNQNVTTDDSGKYTAQNDAATYQRMVIVGYGHAGGQLVGTNDDRPMDGITLNDRIEDIQSQVPSEMQQPVELFVATGTKIGVRINADTSLSQ